MYEIAKYSVKWHNTQFNGNIIRKCHKMCLTLLQNVQKYTHYMSFSSNKTLPLHIWRHFAAAIDDTVTQTGGLHGQSEYANG